MFLISTYPSVCLSVKHSPCVVEKNVHPCFCPSKWQKHSFVAMFAMVIWVIVVSNMASSMSAQLYDVKSFDILAIFVSSTLGIQVIVDVLSVQLSSQCVHMSAGQSGCVATFIPVCLTAGGSGSSHDFGQNEINFQTSFMASLFHSSLRLLLLVVQVEVQHQQFGLLRPVPAAGSTNQPSIGRSDSPHDAT